MKSLFGLGWCILQRTKPCKARDVSERLLGYCKLKFHREILASLASFLLRFCAPTQRRKQDTRQHIKCPKGSAAASSTRARGPTARAESRPSRRPGGWRVRPSSDPRS